MESTTDIYGFTTDNNPTQIIYLTHDFIMSNMNTVFQRLIGVGNHELTTKCPSKDAAGNYTILELLGLRRLDIVNLISFLRTGQMPESNFQPVLTVSVILGGFPRVDQYISDHYHQQRDALHQQLQKKPICPLQDYTGEYQWQPISLHNNSLRNIIKEGWTATGHVFTEENSLRISYTYLRRSLVPETS